MYTYVYVYKYKRKIHFQIYKCLLFERLFARLFCSHSLRKTVRKALYDAVEARRACCRAATTNHDDSAHSK